GITMEMYDENDHEIVNEVVYADVICNNCDTPGARKVSGTAGHSSDLNPCPWCRCVMLDINRPVGYIVSGTYLHFLSILLLLTCIYSAFELKDDYDMLKQKYYHKDALLQRRNQIVTTHGVCFSALDYVPGWRPSRCHAL